MVDGGYRDETFTHCIKSILGETVTTEVAKRDELHKFKVILRKNCKRYLNTSLQFVNRLLSKP